MDYATVNGEMFPYVIEVKKRNRRTYIRRKDGYLYITSPRYLSTVMVEDMILRNFKFCKKLLEREEPKRGSVHYLGKEYNITIVEDKINQIVLDNNEMIIHARRIDDNYIARIIQAFYKSYLEAYVKYNIEEIKKEFGISFDIEFVYKNVKTYFGECFINKHLVILSTRLAKYEEYYIRSVIYHELAHFFYNGHQKGFYNLLESKYPSYKKVQASLRKIKYNDFF